MHSILTILFTELWLDKSRHNTKQAHRQGYYGISVLIPKCNEIYTQNKDKIWGQKLVQICNISHCHMGNTHPVKSWKELTVDVTSPNKSNIYQCADLSHDTVKCPAINSNTRQHKTNTCIPKKIWFLPVWHNLHQDPAFIKNAVMDQWCKPEGKNHYSGHIPMSAVNALIIDQLSHNWMGILATTCWSTHWLSFPQQGVYPEFWIWI